MAVKSRAWLLHLDSFEKYPNGVLTFRYIKTKFVKK